MEPDPIRGDGPTGLTKAQDLTMEAPTVYGPAPRNHALHLGIGLVAGLIPALGLVWLVGSRSGIAPWALPAPASLGQGDMLALLLAALCLAGGILGGLWRTPTAIIAVCSVGVTTRLLGSQPRTSVLVHYSALRAVEVMPMQGGEQALTIRARAGAGREWFQIRCREATGVDALEIARQIAARARAAGVTVRGPEMRGMLGAESIWSFDPPADAQAEQQDRTAETCR